ncbi:hypothetical protein Tco_1133813 [Tanacetum coccineum]
MTPHQFSYKIISVNDLKTDLENDNDKVNMPSFPSPEPMVSCIDDLDFFKEFENEFSAIVYNDALTSKSDFLSEPTISIQHINEFNLKDEISLSECDDSKSDKDNDDDKIDIKQSSGVFIFNTIYRTYSLNEYNVFGTCINMAYPEEPSE